MKKLVCHFISHNLADQRKVESVKISKQTNLKLFNDSEHLIISKITAGDETHIVILTVPIRQESKVKVFEEMTTNQQYFTLNLRQQ